MESEETNEKVVGWTRPLIVVSIIFLVLLFVVTTFAFRNGLLWAVLVGILYAGISFPIVFFVDVKTKRNVIALYGTQFLLLFLILYIYVGLRNMFAVPVPYAWDVLVFAFSGIFAGGPIAIYLFKIVKPRMELKIKEELKKEERVEPRERLKEYPV